MNREYSVESKQEAEEKSKQRAESKNDFFSLLLTPGSKKLLIKYQLKDYSKPQLEKGLRKAAYRGDLEDLKKLIALRIDINARGSKSGKTALHFATQKGASACVEMLLKNHADPSIADNNKKSPADYTKDTAILHLLNEYALRFLNALQVIV